MVEEMQEQKNLKKRMESLEDQFEYFFKHTPWCKISKCLIPVVPVQEEETRQNFYCKVEFAKGRHRASCSVCLWDSFWQSWVYGLVTHFCLQRDTCKISHLPHHHLPLLVRCAHSTLTTRNLMQRYFTLPSRNWCNGSFIFVMDHFLNFWCLSASIQQH